MLKIGVPSKGRLMEKTFDWFGARGVQMRQSGAEREYAGRVDGVDGAHGGPFVTSISMFFSLSCVYIPSDLQKKLNHPFAMLT